MLFRAVNQVSRLRCDDRVREILRQAPVEGHRHPKERRQPLHFHGCGTESLSALRRSAPPWSAVCFVLPGLLGRLPPASGTARGLSEQRHYARRPLRGFRWRLRRFDAPVLHRRHPDRQPGGLLPGQADAGSGGHQKGKTNALYLPHEGASFHDERTSVMTGIAVIAVERACRILDAAVCAAALTVHALKGKAHHFHPAIGEAKPFPGRSGLLEADHLLQTKADSPRWRTILRKPCRIPIPSGVLLRSPAFSTMPAVDLRLGDNRGEQLQR